VNAGLSKAWDYVALRRMETSRRLFIGIAPSKAARAALENLQKLRKPVLSGPGLRWTSPLDLHLTLHFLGSLDPEKEGQIWSRLGEGFLGQACEQPFDRWHHFPSPSRPRVEAVGAATAVPPLQEIWETIGQRVQEAGLSVESRAYVPHVTIARLRGTAQLGPLPPVALAFPVTHVALFESVPLRAHRYRILQEFALDSAP
jgi:RNA 2',3'-cyclic 3'-phosphodiesterase